MPLNLVLSVSLGKCWYMPGSLTSAGERSLGGRPCQNSVARPDLAKQTFDARRAYLRHPIATVTTRCRSSIAAHGRSGWHTFGGIVRVTVYVCVL